MVLRKLSLHLHHAQTQTSFPHHHDAAKSPRGADLKAKKMKKSASIKRPKTATPNYMKPTTSSDARKEQSQSQSQSRSPSPSPSPPSKKRVTMVKKPSFKPARKSADAKTATCSSTLKDSKFPSFLSLNQNGHSAVKVCPYTYCSLNGHHHPPLSSLLSAARRARAPPARANNDDDDDGFFVEIYTAPQDKEERVSEEFSQGDDSFDGSYMDWETGYGYGYGALLQYDYKAVEIKDELVEDKGCCFDEVLIDEAAQESFDEDGGFNSDAFSSSGDSEISTLLQQQQEEEEEEGNEEASSFDDLNQECVPKEEAVAVAVEASSKAECNVFENAKDMIALLQFAASSKKVVEEGDELRGFNPRAPNFLAVEAGPEAERVDLRHQDLDERRNSEEWMVDYALRQVVTKLGPAKKRKVALLVEAFERVMPLLLPPRNLDPHLSHASPFDQPRPMQECS